MRLIKNQQLAAKDTLDTTVFLEGLAGTGKTTTAIERVKNLLREGFAADSIVVLVPQVGLAQPYRESFRRARVENSTDVRITTMSSIAHEMIDLYWPLIAEDIGFARAGARPNFLSLELVQYYMTRFIEPEIRARDYFNSVHINPNRLYTQIVDNLNKAALIGFPHDSISARLKAAWGGDVEQAYIYDDAQACAMLFRERCRDHNMIDFSLQMILFVDYLLKLDAPRRYLLRRYRHLIVDNIEEDNPAAHDVLTMWLARCDSALVIYDTAGGYRRFLGADPVNAYTLKERCKVHVTLDKGRVMSPPLEAFQAELAHSFDRPNPPAVEDDARLALTYADSRYLPEMVDWTVENIAQLIRDHDVPPNEIVILSAFLPDVLRFSLQTRLNERGIANRSHRPSRALREEPATRTLITLARLAHPAWKLSPSAFDTAFALTAAVGELDLVRSRLLVDTLYRQGEMLPFERIQDSRMQNRITFDLGARYETLRKWLEKYRAGDSLPLDAFFSKLFGEVLSQRSFGFYHQFDAANTAANLIDSAREFRQTVSAIEPDLDTNREYIRMVDAGVIANQYVREPDKGSKDAVLIAPAYAFLMSNTSVDYQFWLNIGSTGWGQRLYQPLTQPHVLSRQWPEGQQWTDADEHAANQETVYQLASGLIRRCRKRIYLGFSEYGEQGYEQRGALLLAIQSMLRRLSRADAGSNGHVQTTP